MIVPEGFDYTILSTSGASPSAGGALRRMLWTALLGLSTLIILWRFGLARLLARSLNPFLLLFVLLAIASVGWSIDPSLSARRLVRLVTIVLSCCAFVMLGWNGRRFQNVVRPLLTLVLLGSLVFGLIAPSLAIHQEAAAEVAGAWRGLANHKNGLGILACFGCMLWVHGWLAKEVGAIKALGGIAIALACLLLSRSMTALATTCFVTAWLVLALRCPPRLQPYMPYLVALLLVAFTVYALAVLDLIPGVRLLRTMVGAITDKDMTLTGRTQIWAVVVDHIRYHPLFGTGYSAYWTPVPVEGTDAYAFMWRMNRFYPGSAHNGYLDVMNDLGLAGLGCLIGCVVVQVWQSLQLLGIERSQATLYLAFLFQQAITNLSETHWFSVLSLDFVFMTLATVALARGLLEFRFRLVLGQPVSSPGGADVTRAMPARNSLHPW